MTSLPTHAPTKQGASQPSDWPGNRPTNRRSKGFRGLLPYPRLASAYSPWCRRRERRGRREWPASRRRRWGYNHSNRCSLHRLGGDCLQGESTVYVYPYWQQKALLAYLSSSCSHSQRHMCTPTGKRKYSPTCHHDTVIVNGTCVPILAAESTAGLLVVIMQSQSTVLADPYWQNRKYWPTCHHDSVIVNRTCVPLLAA